MSRFFWWGSLLCLLASAAANSAPIKGAHVISKARVPANAQMEFEERFQGGSRACVIAVGDHKPPVEISVAVYDEEQNLIVEDQGVDYAAAIWYPPRAAKYKIKVNNRGIDYNDMYLVFK